ncbi:MAG: radical SAM protein [Propionibacteriaceae bacterium]|jgi:hypothetical protein|nr:radical SAM protein [Propionibacteriaceae bacterium]
MAGLTDPQELKFGLLACGAEITAAARSWLQERSDGHGLSSADYASTSGLILKLEDDVWVNVPEVEHNPNFVGHSPYRLDAGQDGLHIEGDNLVSRAWFWPQPSYHGAANGHGPLNWLSVTHGDRVRLSPLRGCAMVCEFCNIPYDDPISVYTTKPIDACVESVRTALEDPAQPASHVLISGGTPKPKDIGYEHSLYEAVITGFPGVDVDIMMAPVKGVLDVAKLKASGVNELSVNVEIFDRELARRHMRSKYHQGLGNYLDFIEEATGVLGPRRVRSILLVGLEPIDSTLAGVAAIAERGGVPVLSPFRPDPATPLRHVRPPTGEDMREVLLRSQEIVDKHGAYLGPSCAPCTHNTLGFAIVDGHVNYPYTEPRVI